MKSHAEDRRNSGGIDIFRIAAALLVIAIHTSPLSDLGEDIDFLLTGVAARIAVPFFLTATGYFVLPQYIFEKSTDSQRLMRYMKKTLALYAAVSVLYLPAGLYAGHYAGLDLGGLLRMVFFDGTFYHLWYLPASMTGAAILYGMGRVFHGRRKESGSGIAATNLPMTGICIFLYLIGLFGDSYYGLVSRSSILSSWYDAGFHVFSYTRNGLFLAPVFLLMGAWFGYTGWRCRAATAAAGFFFSMSAMLAEGLVLRGLGLQRHDSMYFALPPCAFFLFALLLSWKKKPKKHLRDISMYLYLLHPLAIILVRGGAKAIGLTGLLIDCSVVHYLAVCGLTWLLSEGAAALWTKGAGVCLKKQTRAKKTFRTGRAWIELDKTALRHNVEELTAVLPKGCELMPVLKADAYGHGAVLTARELCRMGIGAFCVATVSEGAQLRRSGIGGEILVLGYTHPKQFPLLIRYRLIQTVVDGEYADTLNRFGKKLRVHIGVDTGMHRLGERCEDMEAIRRVCGMENLRVEGIFTHLCAADTQAPSDQAFTMAQARAFYKVTEALRETGFPGLKAHLLSSYGLLHYPELAGAYARVGIALYGVLSDGADLERCGVPLRPVLSLKARVASVKTVYRGETAGYGRQFIAERDCRLAALTIGYADGLPRALSGGVGKVLIHGREAPVAGRICMDQTLVDVTRIPDVKAGDIAVIIGRSGAKEISVCEVARQTGTIANEILSRLGQRLERTVTD